ncbi:hypothetical protein OAJ57_04575, partial [Alphaproteobacteria bacterium]|nr:hypothetical protein [Alphaproteobacteria bacterium]
MAKEECGSGDDDACGRSEDLQTQVRDRRNQIKRVAKTAALKTKLAASGKPSYLEQSRYLHVWADQTLKTQNSSTGFRLDPATLTYFGGVRRIHTGGSTSNIAAVPDEGREHLKQVFPLKSGKKWSYDLTGSSTSGYMVTWGMNGEVTEEMIRTDPVIGPIYCFRIGYNFNSSSGYGGAKGQSTLCPVYGFRERHLKTVLGIDGTFNFSRTKLRPVFVDTSGPEVTLKKTVLARFIKGTQDPEAIKRQRLLAEAKQKTEKGKRRVAVAKAKRPAEEKLQAEI